MSINIVLLSTELGVAGVVKIEVGRCRGDCARLPTAAVVQAAAARARRYRNGTEALADLYRVGSAR